MLAAPSSETANPPAVSREADRGLTASQAMKIAPERTRTNADGGLIREKPTISIIPVSDFEL
jgi:hypothetical protein